MTKSKKKKGASSSALHVKQDGLLQVDPTRVRFQHSRIRPFFSGCGRSVIGTLDEIRQGRLKASQLPPIQVLVGPIDPIDNQPWYFSLNNRRLWVLKRCHEEGLLLKDNHKISVRVRPPKSQQEMARYTLENCAIEAKLIREKTQCNKNNQNTASASVDKEEHVHTDETVLSLSEKLTTELKDATGSDSDATSASKDSLDEGDDDSNSHRIVMAANPFQLSSTSDESSDDE